MSTTSGIGSIKPYQKESNLYHLDSFTQKREKTVLICVLMCLQQQLLCYPKGEQEQFLIFTMGAPGKKKIVRILYKKKKTTNNSDYQLYLKNRFKPESCSPFSPG